MRSSLLAVAGLCLALSGCIFKPDSPPLVDARVWYASQYNHRGQVMNDRGVAQADLNLNLETRDGGEIDIYGFANVDLSNSTGDAWMPDGHAGKVTETDIKASYSRTLGPVDAGAGLLTYVPANGESFPFGRRGTTTEMFGTVSGTIPLGIEPRFEAHYDFDEGDGWYLRAGLGRTFAILEKLSVGLDATAGWTSKNQSKWDYGIDEQGFSDVRGTLEVRYEWDPQFDTFVGVHFSTIIDDDIRDWFDQVGIEQDNLWVTAGLGWHY